MKAIPANVNRGDPWSQLVPLQGGSPLGRSETLRWRTTTPFGDPVVPEVYMMSARSSSLRSTWISPPSGSSRSGQATTLPAPSPGAPASSGGAAASVVTTSDRVGTLVATAARVGRRERSVTAALASAWARIVASSTGVRRVLVGTATAPALCTAA